MKTSRPTSRGILGLAAIAGTLVVSVAGCSRSYGPLRLGTARGAATVPFTIGYTRAVSFACDTNNKINPCQDSTEPLAFVSASCGPGCSVVAGEHEGSLRIVASTAGSYVVRVEAQGLDSGERVSAESTVEVVPVEAAEVTVEVGFGSPPYSTLYTALAEGGRGTATAALVERGTATPLAWNPSSVAWSASGGTVERTRQDDLVELRAIAAGGLTVEAVLSEAVRGRARVDDVLSPAAAVRTHVYVNGEMDPKEIDATHSYGGVHVFVALEDAQQRRYAAGAESLRIEGSGCTLTLIDVAVHPGIELSTAARLLRTEPGARCTLVAGASNAAARFAIVHDAGQVR